MNARAKIDLRKQHRDSDENKDKTEPARASVIRPNHGLDERGLVRTHSNFLFRLLAQVHSGLGE